MCKGDVGSVTAGNDKIRIMFVNKLSRTIGVFSEIRDFPFEVNQPGKRINYQELVETVRERRRGGCSAKHYLLGWELQSLGIYPTFITFPFFWQDLQVDYPGQVRQLAEKMPVQYHLALAVIFPTFAFQCPRNRLRISSAP